MKCVSAKHAVEMDYSASCYLFEGHILCFEQYLILKKKNNNNNTLLSQLQDIIALSSIGAYPV